MGCQWVASPARPQRLPVSFMLKISGLVFCDFRCTAFLFPWLDLFLGSFFWGGQLLWMWLFPWWHFWIVYCSARWLFNFVHWVCSLQFCLVSVVLVVLWWSPQDFVCNETQLCTNRDRSRSSWLDGFCFSCLIMLSRAFDIKLSACRMGEWWCLCHFLLSG